MIGKGFWKELTVIIVSLREMCKFCDSFGNSLFRVQHSEHSVFMNVLAVHCPGSETEGAGESVKVIVYN